MSPLNHYVNYAKTVNHAQRKLLQHGKHLRLVIFKLHAEVEKLQMKH